MNAIHAFITSLTVRHNNVDVVLNVQHLNDVFFGARMQEYLLQQNLPVAMPAYVPQPLHEGLVLSPQDNEEDQIFF